MTRHTPVGFMIITAVLLSIIVNLYSAQPASTIVGAGYFLAPVTTDLQRCLLGDDTIAAYGEIDADAVFGIKSVDTDLAGFLDAIRNSIQVTAKTTSPSGSLRLDVVYGTLRVDQHERELLDNVLRDMGHDAGFTRVTLIAHNTNTPHGAKWRSLDAERDDDRTLESSTTMSAEISVFAVCTPLSRHLTDDNCNCFIDVSEPDLANATTLVSASQLDKVAFALRSMTFRDRRKVVMRVKLVPSDSSPTDRPQVHQGSSSHTPIVRLLRDSGFQDVTVIVKVGATEFRSEYH